MEQIDARGQSTTIIHLVYPLTSDSPPEWRIACMPNMTEFHSTPYHPNYQRTDSVQAVSCPACKRTEIYKRMKGK